MMNRRIEASKMVLHKLTWLCLSAMVLLVSPIPAAAQDRTSPDRGFKPTGSYAISDIESIDTINGNLMFHIPLASLPAGRAGLSASVNLIYNSKIWDPFCLGDDVDNEGTPVSLSSITSSPQGNWRYGIAYTLDMENRYAGASCSHDCDGLYNPNQWKVSLVLPDGSKHIMHPKGRGYFEDGFYDIDLSGAVYTGCGIGSVITGTLTYYSLDGTYLRLDVAHDSDSNPANNPWTLYLPDGKRVTGNQGPQRIYDRNSNYIEIQNITYNSHPATKLVDQLNRSLIVEYDATLNRDYVRMQGVNNEDLTWTITWKNIRVRKTFRPHDRPNWNFTLTLDGSLRVVDQIILPSQAGALAYTFDYTATPTNPYPSLGWGEVNGITLPTGGRTLYHYANDGKDISVSWHDIVDNRPTSKEVKCHEDYDGDSHIATDVWQYSLGQIIAPDGGVTNYSFFGSFPGPYGPIWKTDQPGFVTERRWKENVPAGLTSASAFPDVNPYVKTEYRSVKNAAGTPTKTAIKDYTYDKNGNVTSVKEYDWVAYNSILRDSQNRPTGVPASATLKRVTVHTYFNPTPDADSTIDDPDAYSNPTAPSLRIAIESSETRNGLDQAQARTEYLYDNSSTTGNLIQQKGWDSTKGIITRPLTSLNSISSSYQYDSFGNPTLITDPRSIQTLYVYGSVNGFTGLYVTQSKLANGTAVARTTDYVYDFYSGAVTSVTDADNGVTTRTSYDVFGRPTLVQEAYLSSVERRTTTEYSIAERRLIVRSDLSTTGDGELVSIMHFDQLGRIRLSRQLEDAASQSPYDETTGIKVQTRYKYSGSNQFMLTSNPYRAGKSSEAGLETTMGWSRTKYDRASRAIEAQAFSGIGLPSPWDVNNSSTGKTTTAYDSETATVTDQAGKTKRSMTDGLGRLVQLVEDPTGLNYSTSYGYNALDNLVSVTQGTQTRYFMFDSLKRLIRARNAETGINASLALSDSTTGNGQWSAGYSYDPDGNVAQRIDPRNITTTYVYDALNRVTSRSYTNHPANTPPVSYTYDSLPLSKGRLTSMGSSASTYSFDIYDELGRVKRSTQTTPTVGGTAYQMNYDYDLAGNMTKEVYPSGKEVRTSFDNAGRVGSLSRYIGVALDKTYVSQVSYTVTGEVSAMQLGNTRWEHANYNSRLQPTQIGMGISSTDSSLLRLDYDYGTTANNGNLMTQSIGIGATTISQSYSYDQVNRLKTATEAGAWSQTYSYDQYGNRAVTSGYVPNTVLTPQALSAFNVATNRLTASVYDTSGNQIQDGAGRTFSYDAENLQVSFNGGAATYSYDADGRRVKKVDSTGTTVYVYNVAGQLLAEYTSGAATGSGTSYLTTDMLGSTRLVTKADGTVKARYDYLPFGEELGAGVGSRTTGMGYGAAENTKQKFTQKERDAESELDYFLTRYYNSAQGRFTSPDSYLIFLEKEKGQNEEERSQILVTYNSQPQVWNKYVYTLNNPLKYTDPDGRRELTADDQRRLDRLREEIDKAKKANDSDLVKALTNAIDAITAAIKAVPQGQEDPVSLRATFYAIDHLGDARYATDGNGSALYINSNGWNVAVGARDNKCNFFVAASYALGGGIGFIGNGNQAGIPVTKSGLWGRLGLSSAGNAPSANTWAAGSVQNFVPVTSPEVGDVAGWKAGIGAGHSGIYIGGGAAIYASTHAVKVQTIDYVNRDQASHGGSSATFKRYVKP